MSWPGRFFEPRLRAQDGGWRSRSALDPRRAYDDECHVPAVLMTHIAGHLELRNVLWSRGRPTGVVDWLNASMGPVELDFSHFRHNLAFHFGYEAAERFAAIYEAVTGERPDPFWEALTLPLTWADSPARREAFGAYASSLVMKLC